MAHLSSEIVSIKLFQTAETNLHATGAETKDVTATPYTNSMDQGKT